MKKVILILLFITVGLFVIHLSPERGQELTREIESETEETVEVEAKKTQNLTATSYKTGYIKTATAKLKKSKSSSSKTIKTLYLGQKVKYKKVSSKWAKVKKGNKVGYLLLSKISKKKQKYTTYKTPSSKIMSYMSYKAITCKSSKQYKLQQKAKTGKYGIRTVNSRYCIALGSYYTTTIGTYVDIVLKNGSVIHCILADCKADRDTDSLNQKTPDGSLVEFIVDINKLPTMARRMGCISYCSEKWQSQIVKIKVYKKKYNI